MTNRVRVLGLVSILSAGCIALMGATSAFAAGKVACLQIPAKLSDDKVNAFLNDPQALLTSNPGGGVTMSNAVQALAGSDSDTLDKLMGLVKTANDSQKAAIAAGLARTVSICGGLGSAPAQNYAALIQTSVANAKDANFASTFQQSSADVATAAAGPGAGPGAEGGGATTDTSQTSAQNNYKYSDENGTDTTNGQYTIGTTNAVGDSQDVISQTTF